MTKTCLGLIGAGAMGSALVSGFVRGGFLTPDSLVVYDIVPEKMEELASRLGCETASGPEELVARCQRVLVAVKPQQIDGLMSRIKDCFTSEHSVISIAAGISLDQLKGFVSPGCSVTRVMPNTPALIGRGMTAISFGDGVDEDERRWIKAAFDCVGSSVVVPEGQMDAVTAVSGSGPAYVYLFLEALIDGAVGAGLSWDVASQLAVETVLGAASMVQHTGLHPAALKAQVTSPAGTTAAGLRVLEGQGVRSALIEAVLAAKARSEELGRKDQEGVR